MKICSRDSRAGKGKDRFGDTLELGGKGGEPLDCKVSAKDTNGAMCAFEFAARSGGLGGPEHVHHNQDEWIYVLAGDFEFRIGEKQFRLGAGESVFIPRKTPHVWPRCVSKEQGRILDVFQPAGNMEEFFQKLGQPPKDLITAEQVINKTYTESQVKFMHKLFRDHGMDLIPPRG